MFDKLAQTGRYLGQTMRLMVGLPEYDIYLTHMETNHPGQQPMTYEVFFRERQQARFGGSDGKTGRCC